MTSAPSTCAYGHLTHKTGMISILTFKFSMIFFSGFAICDVCIFWVIKATKADNLPVMSDPGYKLSLVKRHALVSRFRASGTVARVFLIGCLTQVLNAVIDLILIYMVNLLCGP